MLPKRPVGFGGLDQTAEFFGLPKSDVRRKATSGEWPSYVISGRRVFDIDAILDRLVQTSSHGDCEGRLSPDSSTPCQ